MRTSPLRRERDPKVARLAAHRLFADLDHDALVDVAANVDTVDLPAGALLARQGAAAREVFAISDGAVAVVADGAHVATLTDGDVVGELGVVDDRPRNADVVALTDVVAFVVDARALRGLRRRVPRVGRRIDGVAAVRREDDAAVRREDDAAVRRDDAHRAA